MGCSARQTVTGLVAPPRAPDGTAAVGLRVVGPAVLRVEVTAPAGTEVKVGPERAVDAGAIANNATARTTAPATEAQADPQGIARAISTARVGALRASSK